jgi:hypothetical protein
VPGDSGWGRKQTAKHVLFISLGDGEKLTGEKHERRVQRKQISCKFANDEPPGPSAHEWMQRSGEDVSHI